MWPTFLRNRRIRDAALVASQLEYLSVWAERNWPDHWHTPAGYSDLADALSAFLVIGADHAITLDQLENENNAVIARALLIGIGRSGSHPIADLEAALGVPFPPEAHSS